MAAIAVTTIVSDLEQVLAVYDRIKVYRSTTGIDGAYTEITNGTTRIPLEAGKTAYKYIDTAGDPDYWYKVRYSSTATAAESELSSAQQGEGDPALDVLTVEELKVNFLFGLDLTNDQGEPIPDTAFEFYIKSAVAQAERELDIAIVTTVILDERHDYVEQDYENYIALKLDRFPIQSIEQLELYLPNNQRVMTYDPSWMHILHHAGQVHIIPGSGSSPILGSPFFSLARAPSGFLPLTFRVNYTAGYAKGKVPADIREVVGKLASLGPLNVFGDITLGAGLQSQSLSIDGLSESVTTTNSSTNAGFGARILEYTKELKRQLPIMRRALHPIGLTVA